MGNRYVIPCKEEHLSLINIQPNQSWVYDFLKDNQDVPGYLLSSCPLAVTFMVDETIVGCFGITKDRYAWSLMSLEAGKHLIFIAKEIIKVLNMLPWVWTLNAVDDTRGRRWVEMLGFKNEGIVKIDDTSVDYINYLRIPSYGH